MTTEENTDEAPWTPSCYTCDHTVPHHITAMTWCTVENQGAGILMTRMKLEQWICKRWKPKAREATVRLPHKDQRMLFESEPHVIAGNPASPVLPSSDRRDVR